jgi:hypothetical protein
MRHTFSLFLAAITLTFGGCAGYTVGPIKPKPMKQVRRICVKNFENDTLEPRVSALLANAVIRQMQQDGTYEVTDEAHADAVLDAKLELIQRRPARSLRGNVLQTREYLLALRARYTVTQTNTGVVLDSRSANSSTSFFVSSPNLLTADSNQDERQALPLAAEELATRIVSLISEGW